MYEWFDLADEPGTNERILYFIFFCSLQFMSPFLTNITIFLFFFCS